MFQDITWSCKRKSLQLQKLGSYIIIFLKIELRNKLDKKNSLVFWNFCPTEGVAYNFSLQYNMSLLSFLLRLRLDVQDIHVYVLLYNKET